MCTCGLQVPRPLPPLCAAVPGPFWARGHGWIEPPLLVVCTSHLSLDICNLPPPPFPPCLGPPSSGRASQGPPAHDWLDFPESQLQPKLSLPAPPYPTLRACSVCAPPSHPIIPRLLPLGSGFCEARAAQTLADTGSISQDPWSTVDPLPRWVRLRGLRSATLSPLSIGPLLPRPPAQGTRGPSSTQRERTGPSPSLPCRGVSAGGQQAQAPLPVSPRPPSALLGSTDAFSLFVLSSFTLPSVESGVLSGTLGEVEVGTATGGHQTGNSSACSVRLSIPAQMPHRAAASGQTPIPACQLCVSCGRGQLPALTVSVPGAGVAGWPVAAGPRPLSRSSPGLPITAKDTSPEATLGTSWPPSAAKWLCLVKVINSRRSSMKCINHRTVAGFWESLEIFEEKPGCRVKRSVVLVFMAKVSIVPNALGKTVKLWGMRGSVQFHPTEHEGGGPPVASTALPETLQPLPGDGSVALEMLCVRARRLLGLGAPLTDPRFSQNAFEGLLGSIYPRRNMLGPGPEPGGDVGDPECAASVATCMCWRPSWWRMELSACPPAAPPFQLAGKASPQHLACSNFSREKATDVKIFLLLVHCIVPVLLPCHPSTLPKNCVPFPTAEAAGSLQIMRSLSSQWYGEGAELDGTAQCPQPARGQVRHRLHGQGAFCAHGTCCGDEGSHRPPEGHSARCPVGTPSQPRRLRGKRLRGKRGHSLRCSVNTLESGGESHFADFLLAD
nr:uncharacterized protein LOC112908234 [Vulpes vulpes]